MGLKKSTKFLILLLVNYTFARATPWDNSTVTIAVVEYQPLENNSWSSEETVEANAQKFIKLLKSVNETKLDLIVFPESVLRVDKSTASEIKMGENPCDFPDFSGYIRDLSCAARDSSTYLMINIKEKEKCNDTDVSLNCLTYGFAFYNTDVVFDRSGTIISRYRKYNLFMETGIDRPPAPEVVVIKTDFGVTFGIFTCFDILFRGPAEDLVKEDIDAIIYPTMWYSELPFLTSLQTQQMWAQEHNLRLFAAGGSAPWKGSGGSGVYSGSDGTMLSDIVAAGGTRVYLYTYVPGESPVDYNPQSPQPYVDPDVLAKQMDDFFIMGDRSLTDYNSTVLDTSSGDHSGVLCYDNGSDHRICCEYYFKTSTAESEPRKESYVYHLVAYSGIRDNFGASGGIETCGIIACVDSSLSSCGTRFVDYHNVSWPVTFEEITIKSDFPKNEYRRQFPNSLLSSMRPINGSHTTWESTEVDIDGRTYVQRSFSVKEPQDRLMTFAILGRNFALDGLEKQ